MNLILTATSRPYIWGALSRPVILVSMKVLAFIRMLWWAGAWVSARYRRWQDQRVLESLPFDLRKDIGWPGGDMPPPVVSCFPYE